MNLLLTGHKGFIGSNYLTYLKDNGHNVDTYEWGEPLPYIYAHYDWVIHVGAISSTTETNINKILTQNYDFSCWLLDECVKHNVNLQYSSSASVYGLHSDFSEISKPVPTSPYSWSKYLFERYVEKTNPSDIIVQGFRYFNVYGPNEEHKGDQASPYTKFTQQAKKNGIIKIFEGSENYLRDFIHVSEVIDIQTQMMRSTENGVFNVGTGKTKSFLNVANEIAEKENAKIVEIPMPDILKNSYQKYTCADMTKTRNALKLCSK
jgi:ADP-L-glycero-D-manno-heptose 6-epimerase